MLTRCRSDCEKVVLMSEKILVVEDEIALQETLVYNLKRQGYEVQTCGDGLCALEAARSFHPDLVLLDVMLPGLDGFEVCRVIRQYLDGAGNSRR